MPAKRFKRKTVSKSRPVKRRRTSKKTSRKASTKVGSGGQKGFAAVRPTVQRGMYPFGTSYFVRLIYGVNSTITTNGSVSTSKNCLFRLNSLYDPEQTDAGHQPYMYDQLTAIYSRYQVYGAKYNLTFTDPDQEGTLVGLAVRDAANTAGSMSGKNVDYVMERRLTTLKVCNKSGSQKVTFHGYVNMQQVLGVTKAQYNAAEADQYDSAVGASPAESVVLDAFIIDPNALVATSSIRLIGTIVYYARMFDFDGPAQS